MWRKEGWGLWLGDVGGCWWFVGAVMGITGIGIGRERDDGIRDG